MAAPICVFALQAGTELQAHQATVPARLRKVLLQREAFREELLLVSGWEELLPVFRMRRWWSARSQPRLLLRVLPVAGWHMLWRKKASGEQQEMKDEVEDEEEEE